MGRGGAVDQPLSTQPGQLATGLLDAPRGRSSGASARRWPSDPAARVHADRHGSARFPYGAATSCPPPRVPVTAAVGADRTTDHEGPTTVTKRQHVRGPGPHPRRQPGRQPSARSAAPVRETAGNHAGWAVVGRPTSPLRLRVHAPQQEEQRSGWVGHDPGSGRGDWGALSRLRVGGAPRPGRRQCGVDVRWGMSVGRDRGGGGAVLLGVW